MKSALALLLVLAGCASNQPAPQRVLTPQEASQMPAAELCWGLSHFRPENANTARLELDRRREMCSNHAAAVQAIEQQEAQMRAQALGVLLNQPAPVYHPIQTPLYQIPRTTTNCTSQRIGNQVQTVCR